MEKSCADLAPGMIRSALGPSPLARNARALAAILSAPSRAASANARAAAWAVDAFRRAGADRVVVEKFGQHARSENVIAEIRGREKPKEYVLVAVTLDGPGPHSRISAENAAVLVDALRVIHNTGNIPRRSIRFVLFGAGSVPEQRFSGAWAYIRAHSEDVDRVVAALTLGSAQGVLDGFSVEARPDTLVAVRQAFEPLRTLGMDSFSQDVEIPTAVAPFWLEGVPTLVATGSSGPVSGGQSSRSHSDAASGGTGTATLSGLKRRVAVGAVAAYALADAEKRIGLRQPRAEVRKTIESLGLAGRLERNGLWSQWLPAKADSAH